MAANEALSGMTGTINNETQDMESVSGMTGAVVNETVVGGAAGPANPVMAGGIFLNQDGTIFGRIVR